MAICERCGIGVSSEDMYENHGLKVCEDCKIKTAISPPESCATMKNMIK